MSEESKASLATDNIDTAKENAISPDRQALVNLEFTKK